MTFHKKYRYGKKDKLGEGMHATVFKCHKRQLKENPFEVTPDESLSECDLDQEAFAVKIVRSND